MTYLWHAKCVHLRCMKRRPSWEMSWNGLTVLYYQWVWQAHAEYMYMCGSVCRQLFDMRSKLYSENVIQKSDHSIHSSLRLERSMKNSTQTPIQLYTCIMLSMQRQCKCTNKFSHLIQMYHYFHRFSL